MKEKTALGSEQLSLGTDGMVVAAWVVAVQTRGGEEALERTSKVRKQVVPRGWHWRLVTLTETDSGAWRGLMAAAEAVLRRAASGVRNFILLDW